jgi:hypothetical protein
VARCGDKHELAAALGLTVRRVEQLDAAGVFYANQEEVFDIAANSERYRWLSDDDVDAVADEAERIARALDACMDKMRATQNLAERRKIRNPVLPLVPQFRAIMSLMNEMGPPSARQVFARYTTLETGDLLGTLFGLCGQRLVDDSSPPPTPRRRKKKQP